MKLNRRLVGTVLLTTLILIKVLAGAGTCDLLSVKGMKNMDIQSIPQPKLEKSFQVEALVDPPVIIGQDRIHGLRRLIPIISGTVTGRLKGSILPGGVDSQVIRTDGFTKMSVRYGIKLEDGRTVFIENRGMRRVDPKYVEEAATGKIIDPKYVYFVTIPQFEVYDESLRWLEENVFFCYAVRLPDKVLLQFYQVL